MRELGADYKVELQSRHNDARKQDGVRAVGYRHERRFDGGQSSHRDCEQDEQEDNTVLGCHRRYVEERVVSDRGRFNNHQQTHDSYARVGKCEPI